METQQDFINKLVLNPTEYQQRRFTSNAITNIKIDSQKSDRKIDKKKNSQILGGNVEKDIMVLEKLLKPDQRQSFVRNNKFDFVPSINLGLDGGRGVSSGSINNFNKDDIRKNSLRSLGDGFGRESKKTSFMSTGDGNIKCRDSKKTSFMSSGDGYVGRNKKTSFMSYNDGGRNKKTSFMSGGDEYNREKDTKKSSLRSDTFMGEMTNRNEEYYDFDTRVLSLSPSRYHRFMSTKDLSKQQQRSSSFNINLKNISDDRALSNLNFPKISKRFSKIEWEIRNNGNIA